MQKTLLLLAIAIAHALGMAAQSQMHVRHYSTNDGLSQNTVTGFMQDREGYIWLSTWNGLEKFDNYEFRNYKSYPTDSVRLRYNRINQIMKSPKGNIWCITYDKQLYLFDREMLSFKSPFKQAEEGNCRVARTYPQDDGILWFANEEGDLFRIDENNQAILRLEARSRPEHGGTAFAVFHDRKGYEWALTDKGAFAHNHPAACTSQVFRFVKETDEGTFFITEEGELCQFIPGKGFSTLPNPYPMKPVSGLVAIGSHQLLLPDEEKVVLYDTRQSRFTLLFRETSPRMLHITHIYPANDSTLWMLDGTRVLRCTLPKAEITPLESPLPARDTFRYLHEDAFGGIWVISRQGYFYQYDGASGQLKPALSGRSHYRINGNNFFRDACRNLWAVNGAGFDKIYFTNRNYDYLENGQNIRGTFIDSQKRLWMASTDNRLRIYDAQRQLIGNVDATGRISSDPRASFGRKVYCFYEDEQRRIWLGTRNDGLVVLDELPGENFKLQQFRHDPHDAYSLSHNAIYAICQDTKGRIWVGTLGGGINLATGEGGKLRFHHRRNTWKGYPVEASKVRSLHCTDDGTILAGTTEGLLWFADSFKETSGITFHRLGFEDGLSSNDIMDAIEGTDGRVYLAAYGGGICTIPTDSLRAGGKAKFRYLNMKNGLPSDLSLSLTESKDGNIWICFENYITKYGIHEQNFENYSRNNLHTDLQITEAQPVMDAEGTALYIGTRNGLMRLRLPHLQTSITTPPLVFTHASIQGSNGTARPGDLHSNALSLRPRERNISVTFAALDYTNPQAISYAYRLRNTEPWNYIGHNRTVNLTNLPAGELALEVKSTNGDGVWTENITPLRLEMQPRFRETAWAKILYMLAFIALAAIVSAIITSFANLKRGIRLEKELTALKLRFFTDISHELRTPLTLINSSIDEIQRKKQLTADGQENMQVAQRNVNRMLRLTNQILDFGKIQGQKMKVSIGKGELVDFCRQVQDNFAQLAHEHGIDYRFLHQQERILCYTDWDKVEKILFNLLSNAFKYTAPGKKICLEASANGNEFTLSVTNEGKEINAAQLAHIFERFETLGNKSPNRSTGIGLSLVKDFAHLLHGKAQAESNPQETTFSVTLPATCDAYATDPLAEFLPEDGIQFNPSTAEEIPGTQAPESAAPADETLLIVEDNDELRRFLARMLAEKYRVLQAANGQQAFDMAKEKLPDLIVSDVMMPEMDGIQLVEAVKTHRDTSHIPIILLSAKSSVEDRIQGLEYGADDYLAKPFNSAYLKARIDSLIKQRNSLAAYYLEQRKENAKKGSKPHQAAGEASAQVPPFDDTFIRNVIQFVDEHLQDPQFTIDDMADTMNMSRTVFYRKIKTFTGTSPIDLVRDMRIKKAATLLETEDCPLADVAYRSGFSSPQYFNRVFKEKMNCTPNEYRRKNAVGRADTPRHS